MNRIHCKWPFLAINPMYRKWLFLAALVLSMTMVLAYIAGLDDDPRHAIAGLSCFTSLMCCQILSTVKQRPRGA